ncbi:hypothetical protein PG994_007245 [Apiospora phragmitis]|uniref:Uncharacterized protein n=1 Tax=Apiospora phragmitis TaxID=2905665 RepID=A0ABR1V092_9PEZI
MRELAFVAADPHGKPRASDRKLIRSHCMKEKNRRIGVRRVDPNRPKGQAAIAPSPNSRDAQEREARQPSGRQPKPRRGAPAVECIKLSSTRIQPSQLKAAVAAFAYKVDSAALELLQRFLVTFNKTVTHRFQGCVSFEPYQPVNTMWLLEDEAYLHSVLLVASAMWEERRPAHSSRGQLQQSTRTGHYMNKTLALLRNGLSATTTTPTTTTTTTGKHHHYHPVASSPAADDDGQCQEEDEATTLSSVRDSRISVVATLVILSTLVGDTRALKAHTAGLTQMVRLRGGLRGIRQNPALCAKLRRVDVLESLYSGETPLFLTDNPTHHYDDSPPSSSRPPGEELTTPTPPRKTLQLLIGGDEAPLLAIFRAQQTVARKLNAALATGRPLAEAEFRALVSESQWALVALRGRCATIPAECLRLALLRYPDLARKFETCVRSLEIPSPSSSSTSSHWSSTSSIRSSSSSSRPTGEEEGGEVEEPTIAEKDDSDSDPDDDDDLEADLMLWLLLVGAVSLYGVNRTWLRELWHCHVTPRGLTSWDEVARRLRRRWVCGGRGARRAGAARVRGADVWAATDDDEDGAATARRWER